MDPQTKTLSEHDSKLLLSRHGVPHAPERLADSPDAAADAADDLGYPVAVKLCGASIAHKTERGFVRLGLSDAAAVRAAAAAMLAGVRPEDGDAAILVATMVAGSIELIAGCIDDSVFGRCVMVGVGGVLAEALGDVAFRLAPITTLDAQEMIGDLATTAVLGSFRGNSAVDRDELAGILVGLSEAFVAEEDIVAIDVNPLVVVDGHPIAVDALVEVRS